MTPPPALDRRALLGVLASLWPLAGCTAPENDGNGGGDTTTSTDRSGDDGTTSTAGTAATDATETTDATADLDLREANVTGVAVSRDGDGYTFDVALYHDDDGEAGYANWWQVETLAGDRIGRRDLAHPHGTREFTRSNFDPFAVPGGTTCVVARGHDETHGYGGQAALVALESGTVRFVRQGPDPASFEAGDCPS